MFKKIFRLWHYLRKPVEWKSFQASLTSILSPEGERRTGMDLSFSFNPWLF
jgi:hypothetical protein